MKKSFTLLAAVLVTLCTSSTALAKTPAPASGDGVKIAAPSTPKLYYSSDNRAISAPQFLARARDVEVMEGQMVTLEIRFNSMPTADVELRYMGGNPAFLQDMSRYAIENGWSGSYDYCIFRILQAVPEDSGEYIFKVSNRGGSITCSAIVKVKPKTEPEPELKPEK